MWYAGPCAHRRRLVWGNSCVDRFRIASTCLFLAGKVEEMPRDVWKIKAVVVEAYKMQHQNQSGLGPAMKEFLELREQILVCERILLQALNFDLDVQHPYRRSPHKRCPPPHAPDAPNGYPAISTDPRSGPYFDLPTALAPGLTLAPIRSQPAADLCEEHREGLGGGWRPGEGLGAGCVEFHQRQPSHDHCVACALPPPTAPARRAFSLCMSPRLSHPAARPRPAAYHRQHLPPAQYTPQCVAASAVCLASRFLGVALPTRYEAMMQADVEAVAERMLAYYRTRDGEDPIERQQRRRECVVHVRRRRRHERSAMHGTYYTQQHVVTGTCVPRCVMRCRRRPKRVPRACGTCSCGAGPDRDPRTVYYYFAHCLARGGRALARPEATKAAGRLTRRVK